MLDPVTGEVFDGLENATQGISREALRLANLRERRLDQFVRSNSDVIEIDAQGAPARRGELLLMDADAAQIAAAETQGFSVIGREEIEGLGLYVTRLQVPKGTDLAQGQKQLAEILPGAEISADNLHFSSGMGAALPAMVQGSAAAITTPIGMIDGGVAGHVNVTAQKGFASGAPAPSRHGSSVAYLLHYADASNIRVADVYGAERAGGNALAIAKALGWLVDSGTRVINISLVGPRNSLVERAVAHAQEKGAVIVAAVGNDGPAAPPAYPASYDGVVAVTAVDGRNRALIEAGRALHLDYAAPGADIYARGMDGKAFKLRGTSFASPLVAVRIAASLERGARWRNSVDREALDLGKKGPDAVYGRGLLCGGCRPSR
ncbi:S8 family serine peptidase [Altererythrobacter sp. GH1-8]|uniref:S8 family serine peptidase n=1 Tax=Altererythrobacter sp. GH1-8 TaxID=3349333 RepID=UPI00374CE934